MYKRVGIHTGTLFKRNTHIEEHGGLLASWSHELARITPLRRVPFIPLQWGGGQGRRGRVEQVAAQDTCMPYEEEEEDACKDRR